MNLKLNEWLQRQGQHPRVLAGGVLYPDRNKFTQSFHPVWPAFAFEPLWQQLQEAGPLLQAQGLRLNQSRWTFKNGWVYCRARGDGAMLALIVERAASAQDLAAVEQLLAEFELLAA